VDVQQKKDYFLKYSQSALKKARKLRKEMTEAEQRLWGQLRHDRLGVRFRRQVPFGTYILDFFCNKAKLAIEVDGGQHFDAEGLNKDRERDMFLWNSGLTVLRFSNRDIFQNLNGAMEVIHGHLSTK